MTKSIQIVPQPPQPPLQWQLADDAATRMAGTQWAYYLSALALQQSAMPPSAWHLCGELGVGKTTFTRGFLQGLNYTGRVKSPSYTLLELYALPLSVNRQITVAHFDLYRIPAEERAAQFYAAGFNEYFAPDTICLIEWPSPELPCNIAFKLSHAPAGRCLQVTLCAQII